MGNPAKTLVSVKTGRRAVVTTVRITQEAMSVAVDPTAAHVMTLTSVCLRHQDVLSVNTLGSYECFCQVGFRLDYDQKSCLPLYERKLEEEEEKEVVSVCEEGSFSEDCSVSC